MPSKKSPKKRELDELACVFPNAAGLDIGSAEIVAAVPPDRDAEPVRVFQTFTPDLHALVAWLLERGIDTVVMESTGVFWIPIYELLEAAGITPIGSMRATSRPSLAEKPIRMMLNGCRSSMRLACWRPRFDLTLKFVRFARLSVTAPN